MCFLVHAVYLLCCCRKIPWFMLAVAHSFLLVAHAVPRRPAVRLRTTLSLWSRSPSVRSTTSGLKNAIFLPGCWEEETRFASIGRRSCCVGFATICFYESIPSPQLRQNEPNMCNACDTCLKRFKGSVASANRSGLSRQNFGHGPSVAAAATCDAGSGTAPQRVSAQPCWQGPDFGQRSRRM